MSIQYMPSYGVQKFGKERVQKTNFAQLKDYLRQRIDTLRKDRDVRKAWRINRQAFQHMLYLDDRILEDIGVTRPDVLWANKLPLRENAALELRNIARIKSRAAQ